MHAAVLLLDGAPSDLVRILVRIAFPSRLIDLFISRPGCQQRFEGQEPAGRLRDGFEEPAC